MWFDNASIDITCHRGSLKNNNKSLMGMIRRGRGERERERERGREGGSINNILSISLVD